MDNPREDLVDLINVSARLFGTLLCYEMESRRTMPAAVRAMLASHERDLTAEGCGTLTHRFLDGIREMVDAAAVALQREAH